MTKSAKEAGRIAKIESAQALPVSCRGPSNIVVTIRDGDGAPR